MSTLQDANGRRTALALVSLISLTLVGLGLFSIVTEHYYGSTSKLGRAEVSLWGTPAVLMGVSTVCFGLSPLALWFRSKGAAAAWATASIVAAGVASVFAYNLLRR